MTYWQRYDALKSRQAKDWWTATFGDPASWLVLAAIAEWRIITPNLLTGLTFLTKVASALFIALGNRPMAIWGAILLQGGVLLDHMDGNLARYRNIATLKGGFMDRILDGVSVLMLLTAVSWRVYRDGGSPHYLLLGPLTGGFYLTICYIYWTYAYYEFKTAGKSAKVSPGAKDLSQKSLSTLGLILKSQTKLLNFNHIDYYFWISFGLVLGREKALLWCLLLVIGYKAVERFVSRMNHLADLDKR